MCCERCQNMMVPVPLLDEGGRVMEESAWRCVACGDVVDPVIVRHRRRAAQSVPTIKRGSGRGFRRRSRSVPRLYRPCMDSLLKDAAVMMTPPFELPTSK
jgi:hypothetical protein